jgi:flagellar biosynthetic protein FliQ
MPFDVIELIKNATEVTLWITIPPLLLSMVIGLFISIFQAVTQIQDQSLQFVPKLVFVFLLLFFMFQFNFKQMEKLTLDNFDIIKNIKAQYVAKPEYTDENLVPNIPLVK